MLETENLAVGYGREILIDGINISLDRGKIVTLIGPNGSGKSTILKTLTRQIKKMGGSVSLLGKDAAFMKESQVARHVSMVMTERIKTECMTCREVVETGRFPYTGRLGFLSEEDKIQVDRALNLVHGQDIADRDFMKISDGQRQRIMLARAVCQDTEIIILDEPTSFLDMYYKIDLLKILWKLAREEGRLIFMSLHELELVKAVSDLIICTDGKKITKIGSVREIFSGNFIQELYGLDENEFDPATGMIKLNLV